MKHIIVHCSASPNGRPDTASDIHRWHKARGWSGIGYHYVIGIGGEVEKGRPEYWQGAHARGYNKESIGICLIGTDEFGEQQMYALFCLIEELLTRYPNAKVMGHNDVSDKTCPGFDVQDWWGR